jgi:hypothetical protein
MTAIDRLAAEERKARRSRSFKLRLSAVEREHLEIASKHYNLPAAALLRFLLKQEFDKIEKRRKRHVDDSDANYRD